MAQVTLATEQFRGLHQALDLLSEKEVSLCVSSGEVICLQSGETLFNRGDDACALYLILSGRLCVIKESEIGRKGQVIALLQPFVPVGEGFVVGRRKHGATVKVVEDALLLKFEKKVFEKLQAEHQGVVIKLLKHLLSAASSRLEKCSDRLVHIL